MKLRLFLNTGIGGRREEIVEVDPEDIEGLTETERYQYFDSLVQDFMLNYLDYGYEIIDE